MKPVCTRFVAAGSFVMILGVLSVGMLFSDCGNKKEDGNAVVAEVGGRAIELREITDFLTSLHINYPTAKAEEKARRRQLKKLIDEKLLVIGAYSRSLDADIGIVELVDREKDKFLLDELFRHEVMEKAKVSDDQVREAYTRWFDRVRPLHIVVPTRSEADSLLDQLKAGADFGDLAEAYSRDRSTSVRGGDFGREFQWGELVEPLQTLAFSLKEGEVGGPVHTDFGWHLVKIKSRRKIDSLPLDKVWTPIENTLKRRAQEERRIQQLRDLREHANIQLDSSGWSTLRRLNTTAGGDSSLPAGAHPALPVDSLDASTKDQTFATYGSDGRVTVEQICRRINSRAANTRPDVNDENQLKEFVFQMGLFDLLREQALSLQLDQTPTYKKRLQQYREKLMADKMRGNLIAGNLHVTDDDVRKYYDANPDSFTNPVSYRIREVLVNDEKLADKILKEARRGTSIEELAKRYTVRPGFKGNGGDLGWVSPTRYSALYEAAAKLKPGEIGGPVPGVDQYSVIQLVDVRPAHLNSFDDVRSSIFDLLQKRRGEAIIQTFLDSMETAHPVKIYDDALKQGLHMAGNAGNSSSAG